MRETRAEKTKTSRRRKAMVARKARLEAGARGTPRVTKPPLAFSQGDHLQGLWVTLGLADVAD